MEHFLEAHAGKHLVYAAARGNGGRPIVGRAARGDEQQRAPDAREEREKAEDRTALARRIPIAARRAGASLVGFVVTDTQALLLAWATREAISKTIHGLKKSHAAYLRRKYAGFGNRFEQHYPRAVVDPRRYELPILRYFYWKARLDGFVDDPAAWRWSGHAAYRKQSRAQGVVTERLLRRFRGNRAQRRVVLAALLEETPDEKLIELARMLKDLPPHRTIILGDAAFRNSIGPNGALRRTAFTVEELVAAVHTDLGGSADGSGEPQDISRATGRRWSCVRAVVFHHANQLGIATPREAARMLGRSVTALREWLNRHRNDEEIRPLLTSGKAKQLREQMRTLRLLRGRRAKERTGR